MKHPRPGVLAVRAVNQYRQRDVLTYLALRYYLDNGAARTDQWAREVATDLLLTRSEPVYFQALHFKDLSHRGGIDHRPMFLPCANEALAEAALLAECAKHPQVFGNPECVFSYALNNGDDRSGIFSHYSKGLRERHDSIARACDNKPDSVVRYIDLKRFYPSITIDVASKAWQVASDKAGLSSYWRELGLKLLHDHGRVDPKQPSILTGPMFSHLIANLVLRSLDDEFSSNPRVRYFRYVDDITLVGRREHVTVVLNDIRKRVEGAGLAIHDDHSPKSLVLTTDEWLVGRKDFSDSRRPISWMTLIGDLKRFLLVNHESHDTLRIAFGNAGLRIPVRDYTYAIYERSFLENIKRLSPRRWFQKRLHAVTIDSLMKQALWLRNSYDKEVAGLLNGFNKASPYERKRRIPKLRYRAGRLSYLSTGQRLSELSAELGEIKELFLQSKVMNAVSSGDISELIKLGSNAAQAAAQPMRAGGVSASIDPAKLSEVELQALAIFTLNGVQVQGSQALKNLKSDLLMFAEWGANPELMRSDYSFTSEIACLHGLQDKPRHASILESVFDEDEELAIDAVDQLGQSLSP